jgi:excinuclease UvrABC helicase subunit UvrB
MQFARNEVNLVRGTFRVRGDVLEIHPRDAEHITRIDTFGDEIESIQIINQVTGEVLEERKFTTIYPRRTSSPAKIAWLARCSKWSTTSTSRSRTLKASASCSKLNA